MILATICMRGGSKGVPEKNIKLLNGKPLVFYTIECAKNSELINDIVVSSDSDKMLNIANELGVQKVYKRPNYLATDGASKWDVFINVIEQYEKENNIEVQYLVDLDVTVPLRKPIHIDSAIKMMLANDADVIITGYEPERNPYFNMMEITEDNYAQIVKKSQKPIICRQDAPKVFSLTPAVYVIKKSALKNFKHWSEAKCLIYEIPRENAVDIDTPFDFKIVEFLMNNNNINE